MRVFFSDAPSFVRAVAKNVYALKQQLSLLRRPGNIPGSWCPPPACRPPAPGLGCPPPPPASAPVSPSWRVREVSPGVIQPA